MVRKRQNAASLSPSGPLASGLRLAENREPVPRSIAARLHQMIADGELGPGSQLPSQRDLSERFGVSRASLREALSVLEALGLIQVRPGRGVFVSGDGERRTEWPFPNLGSERDAYEARLALEGQAAALAAVRADDAGLARLAQTVEDLARAQERGDIVAMSAADAAFHDTLLDLCGNRLMASMYRSVREVMVASQSLPMASRANLEETVREHQAILAALRARNATAAAAQMTAHIRAAAGRIAIAI
ncbi:FadR family transcriptional regulator [Alsobacter soli]|uniref:FadR family transcriptional regulator n=1 Tax=Alsobacter soli TaxID=2109933 RepID=A0A2T1HNN0_9HYPH|nr:FCD domain-containing protein [Alsobacter soli]PSC03246.1 FadR family transcriptional regulator [Alsobacter soli]